MRHKSIPRDDWTEDEKIHRAYLEAVMQKFPHIEFIMIAGPSLRSTRLSRSEIEDDK